MSESATVLFDLDGTLADTARDLIHTMNVLLERHGRTTVPEDQVRHMVGAGARKIMERGFAATGEPAEEAFLDRLFDEFLEHYSAHIADHTVLFPGVKHQLELLQAAEVRLAVCTNKSERLTHQLLAALEVDQYFPVVIGGDTLSVRKPDPLHLHEAISRSGGATHAAVMVGDSAPDVDAARAATIPSVCVTYGYTDTPATLLNADLLIDDFDALPGALKKLLPAHFG
jgi:phosphoglycolate phosphatase